MQDKDVLDRLGREVLCAGPGSSLPSRLTDEWIQHASENIYDFLNDRSQSSAASCIGVALVIKTLGDKDPESDYVEVPLKTLCRYSTCANGPRSKLSKRAGSGYATLVCRADASVAGSLTGGAQYLRAPEAGSPSRRSAAAGEGSVDLGRRLFAQVE